MSYLSDSKIFAALRSKEIGINPYNEENLGPNSYDLTLFKEYSNIIGESGQITKCLLPTLLKPSQKIIIRSDEIISVDRNHIGVLSARSNFARLFLLSFSVLVDSGYTGFVSASLINTNNFPITIKHGIKFCQILFCRNDGDVNVSYDERKKSKNMNQMSGAPGIKFDK